MGLVLSTACVIFCSMYLYNFIEEYSAVTKNMSANRNQSKTTCKLSCRSRYERFKASATSKLHTHRRARSREPSIIPRKELACVLRKSRQLRRLAQNSILRNVPKSSKIHDYTTVVAFERASMYGYIICSDGKRNMFRTSLNWRNNFVETNQRKPSNHNRRKLQKISATSTTNDITNQRPDVFKSLNQRTNYCEFCYPEMWNKIQGRQQLWIQQKQLPHNIDKAMSQYLERHSYF